MSVIYRKELRASLFSVRGYILLAAQLLPLGIFVSLYHLLSLSTDFSYTLSSMRWVLAVLIPAITMHTLAAERRTGEGTWLASLPLSARSILLGKFLAAWTHFAIPAAVALLYPLLLAGFGEISLGAALAAWLGYLLLGTALTAVCFYLSALVQRPIYAFLLGAAVSVALCLLAPLSDALSAVDFLSRALLWLDPFTRFGRFTYGYVHLPSVLFLLSCTAFFVYLTVRRVESERRPSRGTRARLTSSALTLLVAAALLAGNLAVGALPAGKANLDLAKSETFDLSGRSQDLLRAIDRDVTLYLVAEDGRAGADGELLLFLGRYADACDGIRVNVVTARADDGLAERLGGSLPTGMSVVVQVGDRVRVIENESMFYYLYTSQSGSLAMTYTEYQSILKQLLEQDTTGVQAMSFVSAVTVRFCGESRLTNTILALTNDALPHAYQLTGNDTVALPSDLSERLWESGYDLRDVAALSSLPSDCDLLLIHAIGEDLNEADAAALSAYLASGGRLLLTTYYTTTDLPRLAAILADYGMRTPEGAHYVCEGDSTYLLVDSEGYEAWIYAHVKSHAMSEALTGRVVVHAAHTIEPIPTDGVTLTPILATSETAYRKAYNEAGEDYESEDTTGEYCFGMLAERETGSILWVASPFLMQADCNTYGEDGNYELTLGAMDYLTGNAYAPIALADTAVFTGFLMPTAAEAIVWSILLAAVLPLGTLAVGFTVSYRRKKR